MRAAVKETTPAENVVEGRGEILDGSFEKMGDVESLYAVELGTYLDRAKATVTAARASTLLGVTGILQLDTPFYHVLFSDSFSRGEADSLLKVVISRGYYDARVVEIVR
ncbi:MAG: hypothetical protein H6506_00725 [Calditrichaeota bacterium]|nr:hypothetical protein [Calditrichota bacterium]